MAWFKAHTTAPADGAGSELRERARQTLASHGVALEASGSARLHGRWRGVPVCVEPLTEERLAQVERAFAELGELPDPVPVAEIDLQRHDGAGARRAFVPMVSLAQGRALRALSGDSLQVLIDSASGHVTMLGEDAAGEPLAIEHMIPKAQVHGQPARSAQESGPQDAPAAHDPLAKRAKLDRLLPLLSCVRCDGDTDLERRGDGLACKACGATYPLRGQIPILLADPTTLVEPTGPVSSNTYTKQMLSFVQTYHDGWVLDCGCGHSLENVPNVVHLEIVPYDNVDVVATADRLPFKTGALDAATCESVLEHVPDPWTAVDELHRVLKPGAPLRVDVPFVAPFHAYPHHFQNFTQSGLDRLMARFEKLDGGIGPHQEPWIAIAWILRLVREGLPDDALRSQLDATTVGGLMTAMGTGVPPAILHPLDDATRIAIAAGFYYYGRKPTGAAAAAAGR